MSLSLGASVLAGRYRLESLIASGGMGEVWRATDLVLDRPVAVKLLREEYARHPETLARFRAEARHAAALSHPAIAQIYDFGEADHDQPFLVMELVHGPALTQVLAEGPLDPVRAADVIAQVAGGLAAAHAAGVVHRDIKPGNLLVGPGGHIKITDFGIAYATGSAPLTRTGMLLGTPAYLAPERVGGGAAGPASDLYSLGMVAYECLAGALPFTGTAVEIALAHRSQDLPPLPPAVPAQVAALVDSLLARDPAARPASAGEVATQAAVLRDALRNGTDVPPTARYQDAEQARVPAPTAYLNLPAGDSGLTYPPPARPAPRRRPPGILAAIVAAVAVIAALGGWLLASLPSSPGPAATTHSSPPAARLVNVQAAALTGRPFGDVAARLRALGLRVRVARVTTPHAEPGTVVSVSPQGRVPVGSAVLVTVATRPGRHDHGRGHGHGDGNSQGGG